MAGIPLHWFIPEVGVAAENGENRTLRRLEWCAVYRPVTGQFTEHPLRYSRWPVAGSRNDACKGQGCPVEDRHVGHVAQFRQLRFLH